MKRAGRGAGGQGSLMPGARAQRTFTMSRGFMTIDEKAEATPAAIPRWSRSDWRLIVVHSGCSMLHVLICAMRGPAGSALRRPLDLLVSCHRRSPGCAAVELPTSWQRRAQAGMAGLRMAHGSLDSPSNA